MIQMTAARVPCRRERTPQPSGPGNRVRCRQATGAMARRQL